MHPLLIASMFAALLAGPAQAQFAMCCDGTVLTSANARALCTAYGGLPLSRHATLAASMPSTASPNASQAGVVPDGGRRS